MAPHERFIGAAFIRGILLHWLHDTSPGKQQTLALLDRSLKIGVAILRQR